MKDGQLAVFFRNNHFSTLCKERSVLYLLVTDQGFLNQPHVVWETLDNIQGDTVFVDQDFNVVQDQGKSAIICNLEWALRAIKKLQTGFGENSKFVSRDF